MTLDFHNNKKAQDMIAIIMQAKNLTAPEAVSYAVNKKICNRIIETGWAYYAYNEWDHGRPDRKFNKLDEPAIEVDFTQEQMELINRVCRQERIDRTRLKTAICYFLIFVMEELGHHI